MAKKKNSQPIINDLGDNISKIIKIIENLSMYHGTHTIFEDFLTLSAIALSNSVDKIQAPKREEQYLSIVKKYKADELKKFSEMLYLLVEEAEEQQVPGDILGSLFHSLELHNHYLGQYFSPQYICTMMGKIVFGGKLQEIEKRGFVGVCEPCVGSGAMILGFAHAMLDEDFNYQTQMYCLATDIDFKAVCMTYIQFAIFGIPAIVTHGNSITMETYSTWYTPMFILGDWTKRIKFAETMDMFFDIFKSVENADENVENPPETAENNVDN